MQHVAELDWWDSFSHGTAELTCVPAAHFSGRTPFDRDATLWCGWALSVAGRQIYFAGDTGFHPAFAEIGQRLGACDLIFMPVGAYEPRWFMRPVHMDPEEAIAAFATLTTTRDRSAAHTRAGWTARDWPADRLWMLNPGETRQLLSPSGSAR